MKKTRKCVGTAILLSAASLAGTASALTIGDVLLDGGGAAWKYIGDYNVGDGPAWFNGPPNYSAIQAAELVFGSGPTYAISTSDLLVDHRAWYDGYGDGTYLPTSNTYGGGQSLPENFYVDVDPGGYSPGDYSAYLGDDRAESGGGAFNHVFVASVPDGGATVLMLGISLFGLGVTKRKLRGA